VEAHASPADCRLAPTTPGRKRPARAGGQRAEWPPHDPLPLKHFPAASQYALSKWCFRHGHLRFDGCIGTSSTRNDFAYVPSGGVHGWHNESDEPASVLALFVPGAQRAHFFEGLAHLGQLIDDQRREWFARHDNVYIE
jgi:hypothetical protein